MFLTFDSILHSTASGHLTANETRGSHGSSIGGERSSNMPSLGKKKWTLLKGILPFASSPSGLSRENKSNSKVGCAEAQSKASGTRSSQISNGQRSTAFQVHSFKFSLEWIGNDKSAFGRERQLYQPRLPLSLSERLRPSYLNGETQDLHNATSLLAGQAKYAGRALAEWDLLIAEYQAFSKRRRSEGVPSDILVETPTLGVEISRRPI